MSNANLRNITNSFQDVRLASLASWKQAGEFNPRDRGGPYVVMQEGFDPEDPKVIADEFVLGRSGKWLSVGLFYRMPVPERRAEFIFGTAAEVMEMMDQLPARAEILPRVVEAEEGQEHDDDGIGDAIQKGKRQSVPH